MVDQVGEGAGVGDVETVKGMSRTDYLVSRTFHRIIIVVVAAMVEVVLRGR